MNNSLKLLAKEARERLKTAGEYAGKPTTSYLSASSSYMVVANIRKIEDDPLFLKVKKVLEKSKDEIIANPIMYVVDKKLFATLNHDQRERYLLKVSKKFNEIKDYIESNNLIAPEFGQI